MSYVSLNVTGLVLDAVGIVLLFVYGPPPSVIGKQAGTIILWPSGGGKSQEQRKIDRHILIGRCALGLIVVGFLLQIFRKPQVFLIIPFVLVKRGCP